MLLQLLDYLKDGKKYNTEQLSNLTGKAFDDIETELKYLERQGYVKKVSNSSGIEWSAVLPLAEQQACQTEYTISEDSFQKLKESIRNNEAK
jgi:hypothetical protein